MLTSGITILSNTDQEVWNAAGVVVAAAVISDLGWRSWVCHRRPEWWSGTSLWWSVHQSLSERCTSDATVSELVILNSTSAQLGYTVPFTSVHAGKYRTEDKLKIQTHYKNERQAPRKSKQHKIQQNKTSLVQALLWHSARKRGGLILQQSRAHTGPSDTIQVWEHQNCSATFSKVSTWQKFSIWWLAQSRAYYD